jgi:hypothetical protein
MDVERGASVSFSKVHFKENKCSMNLGLLFTGIF